MLEWFGCSEREFQRGDEIAWYADVDKIVRNEYNPATAYAFGIYCPLVMLLFCFLKVFFFCCGEFINRELLGFC